MRRPRLTFADTPGLEVQTVSCSSRAHAHALLEAAAFQTKYLGFRKLRILGLDTEYATGTNLFKIDAHGYRPGALVIDPALARRELEWPFEVRSNVPRRR